MTQTDFDSICFCGSGYIITNPTSLKVGVLVESRSYIIMKHFNVLFCAFAIFNAGLAENLNYRSPSINHPELEIQRSRLTKRSTPTATKLKFTHGVASGDPYPNSVIIWTRAVPDGVDQTRHLYGKAPSTCVSWEISDSDKFENILDNGETETSGEVDYTVKIEAGNLQPFSTYYYRFKSCDGKIVSDVGRTKTIPSEDDDTVEKLRFAVYSCANYAEGYFNAYGNVARKDSVDYVLHLGYFPYSHFSKDIFGILTPETETTSTRFRFPSSSRREFRNRSKRPSSYEITASALQLTGQMKIYY